MTIAIPSVEVLGICDADEMSFSGLYADTGLFSPVTAEDQAEAYQTAQEHMRESVLNNADLVSQADTRAKTLLEQFVKNVGESIGQEYTVQFVAAEQGQALTNG